MDVLVYYMYHVLISTYWIFSVANNMFSVLDVLVCYIYHVLNYT